MVAVIHSRTVENGYPSVGKNEYSSQSDRRKKRDLLLSGTDLMHRGLVEEYLLIRSGSLLFDVLA